MPNFRHVEENAVPSTGEVVRQLAAEVMRPAHFFVPRRLALEWEHLPREEVVWEIFRGRLLDRTQTRRQGSFISWNIYSIEDSGRSGEPLLSLKWDEAARQLHVVRAIHSHAWEGYEENGVILTRETRKWVRELVGTIYLDQLANAAELRDELICRLFQAVVGTSRLPLTSLEAPLPAFSLGQLAYFFRPEVGPGEDGPARSPRELVGHFLSGELNWPERAKLLETLLHATPAEELPEITDLFLARWRCLPGGPGAPELLGLLRTLFNEISLSPWTGLVNRVVAFLGLLEEKGFLVPADRIDFLGHLLRQLGRHLTAYDLVVFHHRGANYPDALLLDAVLKAYLELAGDNPELFLDDPADSAPDQHLKRLRRRAVRQGWLLRRRYEGHLVPEAPTSEGENLRVLPAPFVRVPEEQILYPHRRPKQLYQDDPLDYSTGPVQAILRQSLADLRHPAELRELGTALFLERPFNVGKHPLEPDQTLLFSYEAFSRSLAGRRLQFLTEKFQLLSAEERADLHEQLEKGLQVQGIPAATLKRENRPGSVSLGDAGKVAEDFLILRTTLQSLQGFFRLYPREKLGEAWPKEQECRLLLREGEVFMLYDAELRKRVEFDFDFGQGYISRGGIEYPASPLRILQFEGKGKG